MRKHQRGSNHMYSIYVSSRIWLRVALITSVGFLIFQFGSSLPTTFANGESGAVDWASGLIQATGIGVPPDNAKSATQARAMAKRAAQVVALGRLLEIIEGIQVDSTTVVKNMILESDVVKTNVQGLVSGARVVKETAFPDGAYEVTLEINLASVQQSFRPATAPAPPAIEWKAAPPSPIPSDDGSYTGLLINAEGLNLKECLNPKIVMEDGQVVYSQEHVDVEILGDRHVAGYVKGVENAKGHERVKAKPIMVKAVGLAKGSQTDLVIQDADAQLLHMDPKHLGFLKKAKVVIAY